jgi:anti-sigma factor RsiW
MAQCSETIPLLGTFEDGELEPHEMQEVARHLAGCKSCEEYLAGYSTLGRLLRNAAPAVSLDGFAQAVQARIEKLRPPLRIRLGRWFAGQRERFGTGVAVAFAMAATAILTVVIATPLARDMLGVGGHATQMAARDTRTIAGKAPKSPQTLASAPIKGFERGAPGTIISKLETSNPAVAVWSEPSQDTTVIWLPDQRP